ncbi:tetratricopeptide repeat family protein [Bordetella holmesii 44057]|nr:tetratricopeptide repeat family protein [Bordetella holmesii 44057]
MQGLTERLEAMLAKGQDNMLLRFSLGKAYVEAQRYALAIAHLRTALAFDPNYSIAWKWLGRALLESGDAAGRAKPGSPAHRPRAAMAISNSSRS